MEYNEEAKKELRKNLYTHAKNKSTTFDVNIDDILLYHNDYLFYHNKGYGVITPMYIDGANRYIENNYSHPIVLSKYETEYCICKQYVSYDVISNLDVTFNNVSVEILYKIYDDISKTYVIFYYSNSFNKLNYIKLSEKEIEEYFIPDYTIDNLKIIDTL